MWFFFKQKTAYEMRIRDWSSDVCSSDLSARGVGDRTLRLALGADEQHLATGGRRGRDEVERAREERHGLRQVENVDAVARAEDIRLHARIPKIGRASCRDSVGQSV